MLTILRRLPAVIGRYLAVTDPAAHIGERQAQLHIYSSRERHERVRAEPAGERTGARS